jgi:hypothetical protein
MLRLDQKWGVVQDLQVEADTFQALLGAMTVACVQEKKATHFEEVKEGDATSLMLQWSATPNSTKLAFPLEGSQEMAQFIRQWLEKSGDWDGIEVPDTDGSTHKGFKIENGYHYTVVKVTPIWTVYGK